MQEIDLQVKLLTRQNYKNTKIDLLWGGHKWQISILQNYVKISF